MMFKVFGGNTQNNIKTVQQTNTWHFLNLKCAYMRSRSANTSSLRDVNWFFACLISFYIWNGNIKFNDETYVKNNKNMKLIIIGMLLGLIHYGMKFIIIILYINSILLDAIRYFIVRKIRPFWGLHAIYECIMALPWVAKHEEKFKRNLLT